MVGNSQHEVLDLASLLVGTRQQGVFVILGKIVFRVRYEPAFASITQSETL